MGGELMIRLKPDDLAIMVGIVWCGAALALIGLGVRLWIKSRRHALPEPWATWCQVTGLWQ